MKSKDEIIDELGIPDLINDTRDYDGCVDWDNHRSALSAIHTAMQTYHDEGCVEFLNWIEHNGYATFTNTRISKRVWYDLLGNVVAETTTELLKLWKDEKGII